MLKVSVKEARVRLRELIESASGGEEVVLTRRGKPVARIVAPKRKGKRLQSLTEFRKWQEAQGVVKIKGNPVLAMREEDYR